MKRALQFAWLLLLATTAAAAQVVSVQATVTDPNGIPYASGTVSTSLVSAQPEFLNGVRYNPPPVEGTSSTGRFNLQLADNNVLQPAGSTYSITVCSSNSGTVPPFSRTPTCFTVSGLMVTGTFMDLSSLLSSQSSLLNIGGVSSWSQIKAVLTGTCNSSTAVFGDGSCQVPAGGGSPGGSTNALQYNGGGTFAGLNSPTTNGNCVVSFNVTTSASTAPNCSLPGVTVNTQSGSYALAYSDRAAYLRFSGGTTATLTLCQIATNCASNFPFVVQNFNSGSLTITANAADKIDGGALGGSITLLPNQVAFIYQDSSSAPGNWWSIKLRNSSFPRQWSCQSGLGDGLNAIAAGTYLQSFCYNDTGSTVTLAGLRCFADAGTTTMNATNGTGTGLLTGAITCSTSFAAGTQSATTTLASGDFIKFSFVADGTAKQTTWEVSGTY